MAVVIRNWYPIWSSIRDSLIRNSLSLTARDRWWLPSTFCLLEFSSFMTRVFYYNEVLPSNSPRSLAPKWSLFVPSAPFLSRMNLMGTLIPVTTNHFFFLPWHSWPVSPERCKQGEEAEAVRRALPAGRVVHQCSPSPAQVSWVPPGAVSEV